MIKNPQEEKTFCEEEAGVLKFEHVSFCYPGADEDVLHDIHFTARPGETTAIIGSTGSGKSTLVDLIPRFYDVSQGRIMLGGVDIREVSQHTLREKIGYVPQKGVLFSGDIASNILFGNPNGGESVMKEAAQIAQAEEFIEEKPEKYHSHIARVVRMYQEDRNSGYPLQGQSRNIPKSLFLTTVFRHWIIKRMLLLEKH